MNKEIAIDPIIHRPEKESWSFRTAVVQAFTQSCANVPKSEMVQGGDVSGHQGTMNWNMFFDKGMQFAVIRAMINGYVDNEFERNAQILSDQKRWFSVYGATGYPTLANAIPYARKLADLVNGMPYLSVWWDSEASGLLSPSEMAVYNSEVMGELSVLLPGSILEMYTRQSFWDSHVQAGNWSKYPLVAARYYTQLTCPWSDGKYVFRDWNNWRYWQDSQTYPGKEYGAESFGLDHDYFNGNETMYKEVYSLNEIPPEQTCCEENAEDIEELWSAIITLNDQIDVLDKKLEEHTHGEAPPVEPEPPTEGTILVKIKEKHKFHYFKDDDDSCLPDERGKPYMLTDNDLPPMQENDVFVCYSNLVYSCKDLASTPTLIANGGEKFFRIAEGQYKGKFIRQDKSQQV